MGPLVCRKQNWNHTPPLWRIPIWTKRTLHWAEVARLAHSHWRCRPFRLNEAAETRFGDPLMRSKWLFVLFVLFIPIGLACGGFGPKIGSACVTDADCEESGGHCGTQSKTCVTMNSNESCQNTKLCEEHGRCVRVQKSGKEPGFCAVQVQNDAACRGVYGTKQSSPCLDHGQCTAMELSNHGGPVDDRPFTNTVAFKACVATSAASCKASTHCTKSGKTGGESVLYPRCKRYSSQKFEGWTCVDDNRKRARALGR